MKLNQKAKTGHCPGILRTALPVAWPKALDYPETITARGR